MRPDRGGGVVFGLNRGDAAPGLPAKIEYRLGKIIPAAYTLIAVMVNITAVAGLFSLLVRSAMSVQARSAGVGRGCLPDSSNHGKSYRARGRA